MYHDGTIYEDDSDPRSRMNSGQSTASFRGSQQSMACCVWSLIRWSFEFDGLITASTLLIEENLIVFLFLSSFSISFGILKIH